MRQRTGMVGSLAGRWRQFPYTREAVLVFVYFLLITVLITWPLLLRMTDSFVGQPGDNYYFLWEIGWVQKALFELHIPPHFAPNINYPEGWYLAYTDIAPLTIGTALPASLLAGPVFGYNFAILASYLLTGLIMYLWVRRLTGRPLAGLVAGTIFAFSPFRYAHYLVGHLNLLGTQWLPLYFMGLFQILQSERRSRVDLLLTATAIGLVGLSSIHYLYMTLVLTFAVFLGALLFCGGPRSTLAKKSVASMLAVYVTALPVLGLAIAPYADLARKADIPVRSIEYVRQFSASPTDFILPATFHPLWGRWIGDHFDRSYWPEATLYLGAVGLILGVAALLLSGGTMKAKGFLFLLSFSALAGVVLALGISVQWLAHPVMIETPEFLQRWHPNPQAHIPLPGYFLFKALPFYSSMRVWMRYGVFVLLFVSPLAGIGAVELVERLKGRGRQAAGAVLLGLVLLDFWPKQQPFTKVESDTLDLWLSEQPGKGAVAPFPFEAADSQTLIYRTLLNGKPFVGGLYAAHTTPQYMRIGPIMAGFPSTESVSELRRLGVQYVLVSSSAYPDFGTINDRIDELGLKRLTKIGETVVYELR